jgi:hypothetical protein
MAKHIKYFPKNTSARTTYLELNDDDLAWLKTELIKWLASMTESATRHDELWKEVLGLYWNKKTQTLPKSKEGPNSPATFIAGLINNLVFGAQRDISERQMEGIRDISNNLSQLVDEIDNIVFQIGIVR